MGGVAVDPVSAPGHDDANLGHGLPGVDQVAILLDVLHRVADLHRAGVGTQQVGCGGAAAFHVERVVHGTRRMVFGRVERGEIEPVGLDLGALRDLETHGAKDRFDAFGGERDRVQAASAAAASGQRHIECLGAQLRLQFGPRQCLPARSERSFDGLLGHVDGRAARLLLIN